MYNDHSLPEMWRIVSVFFRCILTSIEENQVLTSLILENVFLFILPKMIKGRSRERRENVKSPTSGEERSF